MQYRPRDNVPVQGQGLHMDSNKQVGEQDVKETSNSTKSRSQPFRMVRPRTGLTFPMGKGPDMLEYQTGSSEPTSPRLHLRRHHQLRQLGHLMRESHLWPGMGLQRCRCSWRIMFMLFLPHLLWTKIHNNGTK